MNKLILNIVVIMYITKIITCQRVKMTPVELIDLVRKEHNKVKISPPQAAAPDNINQYGIDTQTDESDNEDHVSNLPEEDCEDAETLKNRKVWSRWSKWGECSVTCGSGTISRHRVCVAGRCAPGEREEQRRPCARGPCVTADNNFTDDLRDVE